MAKKYDEVTIEKGLIAAATLGIRPAARELGISASTVQGWVRTHPERYAEIKTNEAPKWRERAAAELEETIDILSLAEAKLAQRLLDESESIETRDLPQALKNAGLAKAVNVDKVEKLRDRPNVIVERNINVLIEQAGRTLAQLESVDTTTTEHEPLPPPAPTEG